MADKRTVGEIIGYPGSKLEEKPSQEGMLAAMKRRLTSTFGYEGDEKQASGPSDTTKRNAGE